LDTSRVEKWTAEKFEDIDKTNQSVIPEYNHFPIPEIYLLIIAFCCCKIRIELMHQFLYLSVPLTYLKHDLTYLGREI